MYSSIGELGRDLTDLGNQVKSQQILINKFRFKTARYKALFFHRYELSETIQKQEEENDDACTGAFDGFAYVSWKANAVYRTLDGMLREGIITQEEYDFCNEK